VFFVAYLPSRRPRRPELYSRPNLQASTCGNVDYVPWILVLTYVGTFVYSVIDVFLKSRHPPNY